MKPTLLVLLHVLCGLFGYWLAAPSEKAFTAAAAEQTSAKKKAVPKTPASHVHESPSSTPPACSEVGLAMLVPGHWVDFSKAPLDELPALLRGLLRNRFLALRTHLMRYLFERWVQLDLHGALAALRGIPSPQLQERAMWAVLDHWTQSDMPAAWDWINTLNDDSVLQEAGIEHLLHLSAAKDPLGSAMWAAQIEDVFLREKALTRIGDSWMSEDPNGVLAALTSVEPKRLRDYLMSRVCYRDGVDHTAGLEIVSQLPAQAERSIFYEEWLSGYVGAKPQDAFQWLLIHAGQPELQTSAETLGGHFGTALKTGAELLAMARQLPAGPIRDAFAARAAGEWARESKPLADAEALLALCSPSLERNYAQAEIDAKRAKP
jgi:hypothetical protein